MTRDVEKEAMDPERWNQLRELFDSALELNESERPAFIARSCEGDPELQITLESLLDHSLDTGSTFDQAMVKAVNLEDAVPTSLDLLGRTLGRYLVLEKIAEGGMGEVYRATDRDLGRDVAIKILPEIFTRDPERMARFEREAQVLASISHPNIATIHGIEEAEGTRYLVLELLSGETLRSRLDREPIAIGTVVRLATQIAEGLAKAHEAGIVHRDLKPDNLMLTEEGFIQILDFGLAKTSAQSDPRDTVMPTEPDLKTDPGRIMGTSNYMSPEQARGEEVDHRSDQFAFGSVLFEMVTGKRAFGGPTSADTLVAIMHHDLELPADFNDQVPQALRKILTRCLEKDPTDRYESSREMAIDLRNLREQPWEIDGSERSEPQWLQNPKKRSQALRAALFGAIVAAIAVLWWLWSSRPVEKVVAPNEIAMPERESASIAVLPLENLGPANQEYFADGMTDALITHLAKIKALKVISRTSVMRYKDQEKSLPEIGRELDVDTVLVGSVLHAGDHVRISTQLIEAATDRSLWAESYEQDLKDILSLQAEVAQAIARAVRVTVDPKEEARIATLQTVEPEALQAYLIGLAGLEAAKLGSSIQDDSLRASLGHFEQAIRIEPEWAVPYAKMAGANHWLASRGGTHLQAEHYPKAKAAALRALELDSSLAEAHSIVGRILLHHEWDWVGAEEAHLRAIELDPNNYSSWGYARFLRLAGRWDEAVAEFKKVKERYPLSPLVPHKLGQAYLCADRPEEADLETRILLETFPESPLGYQLSGRVLLATSRYEEAVTALEQTWEFTVASAPWMVGLLPFAKAKAGDIAGAREMLHDLEQNGYDWFPELYIALGEEVKAMAQIEAAFAERRDILLVIQCSLEYERLMEIPRFREIVEAIGFSN